ncbi:MAG: methyltransferase domain-containing protein [Rhodospirillales bacterium]|nr:MAG: methyltransferase domain-containing protein [Rhodospirillales bacterium]
MSQSAAVDIGRVVSETRDYYDGPADEIYRRIWGENVHIGYFDNADDTLQAAMQRSNERMAASAGLEPRHDVLDVGCGYGALARFLAQTYGCRVVASNISERELAWGRELTSAAGLDDRVTFQWADFHELPFADGQFDQYWSQEAFLHAVDKNAVLAEAARVLKPGGTLVFTDLLVRDGTPDADRARIYERVKSPDMWDTRHYRAALDVAGLDVHIHQDWSPNVARTYAWVRSRLEERRDEFTALIGPELVDRTSAQLQFWVDAATAGRIGWEYFVARR